MRTLIMLDEGASSEAAVAPEDSMVAELTKGKRCFWLDINSPEEQDFRLLMDMFGFHELAVEDCRIPNNKPKIENYGEHSFLVTHALDPAEPGRTTELQAFVSESFLITVSDEKIVAVEHVRDHLFGDPQVAGASPAGILYEILDVAFELFRPRLDEIEQEIDDIEEELFSSPSKEVPERLHELRHEVNFIRRISSNRKEVAYELSSKKYPGFPVELLPNFRDLYQNLSRSYDRADAFHDRTISALELYRAVLQDKTNDVMRMLTVIATIFIPLTFLSGVFGMNFEWMPFLHESWAFWVLSSFMVFCVVAMILYFKRKDWL
jgi:magnesium transporter